MGIRRQRTPEDCEFTLTDVIDVVAQRETCQNMVEKGMCYSKGPCGVFED